MDGVRRLSMGFPNGVWGVLMYLKGMSGLIKLGNVKSSQDRLSQVEAIEDWSIGKTHVRTGQVGIGQVRTSQNR